MKWHDMNNSVITALKISMFFATSTWPNSHGKNENPPLAF